MAPALTAPGALCPHCGASLSVARYSREETILPWGGHGVYVSCPSCGTSTHTTLLGLVLDLPAAQRFWRKHARIRTLPEQDVSLGCRSALLITLESVGNAAICQDLLDPGGIDALSCGVVMALIDVARAIMPPPSPLPSPVRGRRPPR